MQHQGICASEATAPYRGRDVPYRRIAARRFSARSFRQSSVADRRGISSRFAGPTSSAAAERVAVWLWRRADSPLRSRLARLVKVMALGHTGRAGGGRVAEGGGLLNRYTV